MEQIYLAFVDTPGFFASIIRRVIGIPYVHVVLSMDADLREAYSVGRRNPAVPLIAGFEKENTLEIEAVFPHAKYKVVRMQCTAEQKKVLQDSFCSAINKESDITTVLSDCLSSCFRYRFIRRIIIPVLLL